MIPILHMCDQKYKYVSLREENCPETGKFIHEKQFDNYNLL